MIVYRPAAGGVYLTVKVSLSFLMMSKSMSASPGPTTPGAHLIPMLMSPNGAEKQSSPRPFKSTPLYLNEQMPLPLLVELIYFLRQSRQM